MSSLAELRTAIPAAVHRSDWRAPHWSEPVLSGVFKLIELAVLIVIGTACAIVSARQWPGVTVAEGTLGVIASTIVAFESLCLTGAYRFEHLASGSGQWRRTGLAAALAGLALMACLAVEHQTWRILSGWGLTLAIGLSAALAFLRALSAAVLRRWLDAGHFATKIAVVGGTASASALMSRLCADDRRRVRALGQYAATSGAINPTEEGICFRGDVNTLLLDCRLRRVDAVILAVQPGEGSMLSHLMARVGPCLQDVYVLPEAVDFAGPAARPAALGSQPLLLVKERPLKDWQGVSKAVFDRVGAAVLLVMLAPLLAVVAVLVRVGSPGPILFRQLRVGYNNQLFPILKFRTMRNEAADRLAERQTLRNDPRVTPVGAILRKLSIDELPQLINVLRGDMSLVGPRPHAPGTSADGKRVHLLVENYPCRHLVKPGITGLAQVRGHRGGMHTTQQVMNRLNADLEYIRRQSLWLDVKIMIMTVMREARSSRAF